VNERKTKKKGGEKERRKSPFFENLKAVKVDLAISGRRKCIEGKKEERRIKRSKTRKNVNGGGGEIGGDGNIPKL